jgi:hypothetical protein
MARYFNKTRVPITVSLRDGSSAIVTGKGVLEPTPEQDRSPSILSRVKKGLLIKLPDAPAPKPAAPPAPPAPKIKPAPAPAPAPIPGPAPEPEPEPDDDTEETDDEGDAPSMRWTKSKLIEHAEELGLEVSSGDTKAEILDAIEEASE